MQGHWALPSFMGHSGPEAEILHKKESKRPERGLARPLPEGGWEGGPLGGGRDVASS